MDKQTTLSVAHLLLDTKYITEIKRFNNTIMNASNEKEVIKHLSCYIDTTGANHNAHYKQREGSNVYHYEDFTYYIDIYIALTNSEGELKFLNDLNSMNSKNAIKRIETEEAISDSIYLTMMKLQDYVENDENNNTVEITSVFRNGQQRIDVPMKNGFFLKNSFTINGKIRILEREIELTPFNNGIINIEM